MRADLIPGEVLVQSRESPASARVVDPRRQAGRWCGHFNPAAAPAGSIDEGQERRDVLLAALLPVGIGRLVALGIDGDLPVAGHALDVETQDHSAPLLRGSHGRRQVSQLRGRGVVGAERARRADLRGRGGLSADLDLHEALPVDALELRVGFPDEAALAGEDQGAHRVLLLGPRCGGQQEEQCAGGSHFAAAGSSGT